jgi:hypothetical protein
MATAPRNVRFPGVKQTSRMGLKSAIDPECLSRFPTLERSDLMWRQLELATEPNAPSLSSLPALSVGNNPLILKRKHLDRGICFKLTVKQLRKLHACTIDPTFDCTYRNFTDCCSLFVGEAGRAY